MLLLLTMFQALVLFAKRILTLINQISYKVDDETKMHHLLEKCLMLHLEKTSTTYVAGSINRWNFDTRIPTK